MPNGPKVFDSASAAASMVGAFTPIAPGLNAFCIVPVYPNRSFYALTSGS